MTGDFQAHLVAEAQEKQREYEALRIEWRRVTTRINRLESYFVLLNDMLEALGGEPVVLSKTEVGSEGMNTCAHQYFLGDGEE